MADDKEGAQVNGISIHLLADAMDTIPVLAQLYKVAWTDWFAESTLADIEADFASVASRDRMPFGVVARDGATSPIAACTVRLEEFPSYPHVGPWLRGLYVHPSVRGWGIAGELIHAAELQAAKLSIAKLYAATHTAIGTFERAGWLGFDQVSHDGEMITIFAKRLG